AGEHGLDPRVLVDIAPRVFTHARSFRVVLQQVDDAVLQSADVVFGDDEPVASVDEVVELGWLAAGFGDHGQAPVEGLVESETDVARYAEHVGGLEQFAHPRLAGVVNLSQIASIAGVETSARWLGHAGPGDHQPPARTVDGSEDFD